MKKRPMSDNKWARLNFQGEKRKPNKIKDQRLLINKIQFSFMFQAIVEQTLLSMLDSVSIVATSKLPIVQVLGAEINTFT